MCLSFATANNDVGIEQASPEAIRQALAKVRFHEFEPRFEFSNRDLFIYELSGSVDAAERVVTRSVQFWA